MCQQGREHCTTSGEIQCITLSRVYSPMSTERGVLVVESVALIPMVLRGGVSLETVLDVYRQPQQVGEREHAMAMLPAAVRWQSSQEIVTPVTLAISSKRHPQRTQVVCVLRMHCTVVKMVISCRLRPCVSIILNVLKAPDRDESTGAKHRNGCMTLFVVYTSGNSRHPGEAGVGLYICHIFRRLLREG